VTAAEPAIDDDVARLTDAYVTGYPLVVSTRTFHGLGCVLGVNRLFWQPTLSGPEHRTIVAPNRDTLYAIALLDLRAGPMLLTLPEVTDRYHSFQLLDAWTESFAYLGTRATGGRAGAWAITPPGWDGPVPPGIERIEATTPQIFLLGRYLVDDEADIANVLAIRERTRLEPLGSAPLGSGAVGSGAVGTAQASPAAPLDPPVGTPQTVPATAAFFDELGDALAVNPPTTPAQIASLRELEALGVGPGRRPSASADPDRLAALGRAATLGFARITGDAGGKRARNGWSADLDVGRYGDDTLLRAVVARIGWAANIPEEAVYPVARADAEGEPLHGSRRYRMSFPAGGLPPVDAFWSLISYGPDMFLVQHPSGRYTIGDRTPGLVYASDGTLHLELSHHDAAHHDPAQDDPARLDGPPVNWLPVPEGPFVLMLRLYLPRDEVLTGTYVYPPIERLGPRPDRSASPTER
jgi:hypothetical protein